MSEINQPERTQIPETPAMADQQVTDDNSNPNPLPLGYSVEGLAAPGQFANVPAFPGLNLHENLENQFKDNFKNMIDLFEKGHSEAAEREANTLLQWGNLPVLYRVYSHIVSYLSYRSFKSNILGLRS